MVIISTSPTRPSSMAAFSAMKSGVETSVEADHERRARVFDDGEAVAHPREVEVDGFFAEDRLAELREALDQIGMGVGRACRSPRRLHRPDPAISSIVRMAQPWRSATAFSRPRPPGRRWRRAARLRWRAMARAWVWPDAARAEIGDIGVMLGPAPGRGHCRAVDPAVALRARLLPAVMNKCVPSRPKGPLPSGEAPAASYSACVFAPVM